MDLKHGVIHNIIQHKKEGENGGLKLPIPIVAPPLIPNLLQPKNLLLGGLSPGALLWKPITQFFENILLESGVKKFFQDAAKFLAERPYLSMPLFALALSFLTPILVFVFFAFVTAFVTFSGFLIAEGAVLSIGAVIVGSFLLSTFGISIVLCTLFGVVYFTLQKAKLVK